MQMTVTHEAANWFQRELGVRIGDSIRLFIKYGGTSTLHPGFSLGLAVESPSEIGLSAKTDGIMVFMREDDIWYLNNQDLTIEWDPTEDEPRYVLSLTDARNIN